jgi:hypothetical protein
LRPPPAGLVDQSGLFATTTSRVPTLVSPFTSYSHCLLQGAVASRYLLASTAFSLGTTLTVRNRWYSKRRKMPPKKPVQEEKILLGRPGNSLKSGIVSFLDCLASRTSAAGIPAADTSFTTRAGWSCKRGEIDPLPSHHQVQPWESRCTIATFHSGFELGSMWDPGT